MVDHDASVRAAVPTDVQRQLSQRGYGMFVHFGINTFNEVEWSDGTLPIASYSPADLDCDQWVREAKEAGFRHLVLVAKHHDGFTMWPSAHGDYGVAHSPVPVDVVGAVAAACRRYDVEFGLYYSLWDRRHPAHALDDPEPYVDVMKAHLTELLTQYGDICELWFDGGWAKPAGEWRLGELYELVADLQPGCAVTCNHSIGVPGDPKTPRRPEEARLGDPVRYWPLDFRTYDPNLVHSDDPKRYTAPDGRLVYLPFEHTVCLSERANWFQKAVPVPPRALDELEQLFYWCTAQQNALLLNVPPGLSGRLEDADIAAIRALADRVGIRGGETPLPTGPRDHAPHAFITSSGDLDEEHSVQRLNDGVPQSTRWICAENEGMVMLRFATPVGADRIVVQEHAETQSGDDGFSELRSYAIDDWAMELLADDDWREVAVGTEIGAARIVHLDPGTMLSGVRLRVRATASKPSLVRVAVTSQRTEARG